MSQSNQPKDPNPSDSQDPYQVSMLAHFYMPCDRCGDHTPVCEHQAKGTFTVTAITDPTVFTIEPRVSPVASLHTKKEGE